MQKPQSVLRVRKRQRRAAANARFSYRSMERKKNPATPPRGASFSVFDFCRHRIRRRAATAPLVWNHTFTSLVSSKSWVN